MSEQIYCDWLDTKVCAVCGKHFSVLYPQLWCYKFGFAKKAIWFCSYGCMRVHDKKKEERIVKKITLNEKKRAVEEALAGKDPREYLKSIGVGNPNTCWETIQRYYRTNDQETYRKICEAGFGRKCDTDPVTVAAQVAKVKITGPVEIETPEVDKVEVVEAPVTAAEAIANAKDAAESFFAQCEDMGLLKGKISQPVVYDNMTVREVEGEFGRYRRSNIRGTTYIDFESTDRLDTISLTVDQWRAFRAETERAAAILGVEL